MNELRQIRDNRLFLGKVNGSAANWTFQRRGGINRSASSGARRDGCGDEAVFAEVFYVVE
jgi:hypothetical protein